MNRRGVEDACLLGALRRDEFVGLGQLAARLRQPLAGSLRQGSGGGGPPVRDRAARTEEREDGRSVRKEPNCDQGVKDQASKGRGRHEWPDRVAVEMVHQIPGGVHEPGEPDETVCAEPEVSDRSCDRRIEQFEEAEPATQIHTARARDQDGVEISTGGLSHKRHEQDEDEGAKDWADPIHGVKRQGVHGRLSSWVV